MRRGVQLTTKERFLAVMASRSWDSMMKFTKKAVDHPLSFGLGFVVALLIVAAIFGVVGGIVAIMSLVSAIGFSFGSLIYASLSVDDRELVKKGKKPLCNKPFSRVAWWYGFSWPAIVAIIIVLRPYEWQWLTLILSTILLMEFFFIKERVKVDEKTYKDKNALTWFTLGRKVSNLFKAGWLVGVVTVVTNVLFRGVILLRDNLSEVWYVVKAILAVAVLLVLVIGYLRVNALKYNKEGMVKTKVGKRAARTTARLVDKR